MNRRADRGDDEGNADGQQGGRIIIVMKIEISSDSSSHNQTEMRVKMGIRAEELMKAALTGINRADGEKNKQAGSERTKGGGTAWASVDEVRSCARERRQRKQ